MHSVMANSADHTPDRTYDPLEAARREKLRKISELGLDPWGGRLDDIQPLGEIRQLEAEITTDEPAPGQQHGEQRGPRVRAAGRIVLMRDTGKLIFADIR